MLWRNPFWDIEKMAENIWEEKPFPVPSAEVMTPAIDVFRENGKLVVKADMPGVEKEDINLRLLKDCLCISAQKRKAEKEEKEGFYRSERSWRSYARNIRLPTKIDKDKIKASFENGTMKLEAPIVGEEERKEKGKKIKVK